MPIATWCLLLGLYLVLAGQTTTDELLAAALAAVLATLLLITERRVSNRRFAFRGLAWLRIVGNATRALIIDTLRTARSLASASPPSGTIVRESFLSHDRDETAQGARAAFTLSRSIAPNEYVIEVLSPRHELVLHRLSDPRK